MEFHVAELPLAAGRKVGLFNFMFFANSCIIPTRPPADISCLLVCVEVGARTGR